MDGDVTISRIMVPLDGSALAEAVLPAAVSLAQHLHARLLLLHVMERGAPASVHGQRHLTERPEAEAYLETLAARFRTAGVEAELHAHPNPEGNVPQSIVAHAADFRADLVVLAAHGAGDARRAMFGSVAQQVLRRGERPVLLMRPRDGDPAVPPAAVPPEGRPPRSAGPRGLDLRRLIVPLDGDPPAEAALPFALTLARAYGAEIALVRVVPTLATIAGERASAAKLVPTAAAATLEYEQYEAQRYLRAVADRVRGAGVGVSWAVGRGDPAQGIVDEAEASAAARIGLLIMATHGRTGLSAVFTGSVASKVVGRYAGPVLLVRAPVVSD